MAVTEIWAGALVIAEDLDFRRKKAWLKQYGRRFAEVLSLFRSKQVLSAVERQCRRRADVNTRSDFGSTPLHVAAYNNNGAAITALAGAGANINAKDDDRETPLQGYREHSCRNAL